MKIGILTLPLNDNYGGMLQAWALQTVVERIGHDVELIVPREQFVKEGGTKVFIKKCLRLIKKYLLGKKHVVVDFERHHNQLLISRQQYTKGFIDKYIKGDNHSLNDVYDGDYDCIIVGSDQIWRYQYAKNLSTNGYLDAFLYFAKNMQLKRIAYAASFGLDYWNAPSKYVSECRTLIKKFEAISVREESGLDICKKELGVEAEWVVDPTLLLSQDDYLELIRERPVGEHSGILLSYVLDGSNNYIKLVREIASSYNLTIKSVYKENKSASDVSVEDWIFSFANADFIVTDSFHACVFSIIFRKKFVVVKNDKRGNTRIDSLLRMLGLENNYCDLDTPFDPNKKYSIHDFSYKNLEEHKKMSMEFLKRNLNI